MIKTVSLIGLLLPILKQLWGIKFLDGFLDYGLDGINYTFDEGEGDGQWQPGDSWVDTNNNGIVDDADGYDQPWALPNAPIEVAFPVVAISILLIKVVFVT